MNTFKFVLVSFLFIGQSAFAADDLSTLRFASLETCKTYFNKIQNKSVNDNVNTFCKDRIKSPIELCVDQKATDYLTKNKINALSDMINTEKTNLLSQLKFQCQTEQQKKAIGVSTQQAAQAQQKAAEAAANGSNGSSGSGVAQLAQVGVGLATAGAKIYSDYDKKTAPAAAPGDKSPVAEAAKTSTTAAVPAAKDGAVAAPASAAGSSGDANKNLEQQVASKDVPKPTEAAPKTTTQANPESNTQTASPEASQTAVTEGQKASEIIPKAAQEVASIDKSLVSPAEGLVKDADGSYLPTPVSEITVDAQSTTAEFLKSIKEAQKSAQPAFDVGLSTSYTMTLQEVNKLNTSIQKYISSKQTCSSLAEKSEMLCVEQKSPGIQKAKAVMDAAGPVIAGFAAAQKTCSSTSKITRLVSTGLTIAKGVCVATKLSCDVMCGMSSTELKELQTSFETAAMAARNADLQKAISGCQAEAAKITEPDTSQKMLVMCNKEVDERTSAATVAMVNIKAAFLKEAEPSNQLVAQCQSYGKDILLLGVQIAGTLAAQSNAQKCADKLASSTKGGSEVSVQQYCEKQENLSTDFCKCQSNNAAPGCPGAIVAAGTKNIIDDKGANIKNVGGNSAFANGFKQGAPDTSLKNQVVGDLGSGNSASGLSDSSKNAGGAQGYAGGSLGSGSSGVGAPQSGSDASLVKDKAEKGWSFGSFGSLGGGLSSLFGGSTKNSSGTVGAKQLEAIKRQIASEKISNEVSTASGKSNWEKVRNMYLNKEGSFLVGQ